MNLEDIILSEISHHKKTNAEWFHLYISLSKPDDLIETESRMLVVKGCGKRGMGSDLMGTEFSVLQDEKVLERSVAQQRAYS